jgi:hypothetical protein
LRWQVCKQGRKARLCTQVSIRNLQGNQAHSAVAPRLGPPQWGQWVVVLQCRVGDAKERGQQRRRMIARACWWLLARNRAK